MPAPLDQQAAQDPAPQDSVVLLPDDAADDVEDPSDRLREQDADPDDLSRFLEERPPHHDR